MIEKLARLLIRFIVLILVQALVLNNIRLGGFVNPFLYVLFIILLPVETPPALLMLVSFLLGISMDFFSNTIGIHAAACVFIAFCRPYLLKVMAPRDGYESERPPSMQYMGFVWFLTYSALMIFLHHLVLFYLEIFKLNEFFPTLLRVIFSVLLTLALVILTEFLFFKTKSQQ